MKVFVLIFFLALLCGPDALAQRRAAIRKEQKRLPIIDMHLHAEPLSSLAAANFLFAPVIRTLFFPLLIPGGRSR